MNKRLYAHHPWKFAKTSRNEQCMSSLFKNTREIDDSLIDY